MQIEDTEFFMQGRHLKSTSRILDRRRPDLLRCCFIYTVAFSSGVIIAEEYDKMNGPWFAKFAETTLHRHC